MAGYEVGKRVQIILSNNYFYSGVVLSEDDMFIFIKDKANMKVSINKKDIQVVKEVS